MCGKIAGAVLEDLKKCYEYVRHMKLIKEGIRLQYPLHILRLAVKSYKWKRHVTHSGMLHHGVFPTRGIIAGFASATIDLKVYMYTTLTGLICRHPEVDLDVYIDDVTLESHQNTVEGLVHVLGEAANDFRETMRDELGLEVSVPKIAVVSSSKIAAMRVERFIGMRGAAKYQTRNLGIDYTAGKVIKDTGKKPSVRMTRFRNAKSRMKNVRNILGKKGRCLRIWTTGIAPALFFGAECQGGNASTLKWSRGRVSAMTMGGGKGAHQATVFSLFPDRDPVRKQIIPCITRYAKEVWLASDAQLNHPKVIPAGSCTAVC